METKQGTLRQIEVKIAKNGAEYWCLHIDNSKYNTFDPILGAFKVGVNVEYKIEKNAAGYNSLIDMKEIDTPLGATNANKPSLPKGEFHLTIEQTRSNALDSAIKVTKKLGADDYVGDLMSNAIMFEKYILTGEVEERELPEVSDDK